jgi:helix-turn-helix protein
MAAKGDRQGEAISAGQMTGRVQRPAPCGHPVTSLTGFPADPFLDLRALAEYANLSLRTLARHLADPARPLPHYKVRGKILVRRSEFDAWIQAFRRSEPSVVPRLVEEVLMKFRP